MSLNNFVEFELKIMDWISRLGNKFFDIFFYLISEFGGPIIIIAAIGIMYWCFNKEKGERLAYATITSVCLNGVLKSFVNRKRPFEHTGKEHLRRLKDSPLSDGATGTSFPSGHSQNAGSIYTTIALQYKKKWILSVCIIFLVLIPISRLYLGVHFPSDVIVGLSLGIIIAIVSYFLLNKFWNRKMIIYLLTILIFTPFICLPIADHGFAQGYGLLIGFVGGVFVENKWINFTNDVPPLKKIIRLLVGILLVGSCFVLTRLIPDHIRHIKIITIIVYGLTSFVAIGIVPFTFKSTRHPNGI